MKWQGCAIAAGFLMIASCVEQSAPIDAIDRSLSGVPGDPDSGRLVFLGRDAGHCILCHQVDGLDAEFQGDVGPDLSNVGDRFSEAQLRLRIADYDAIAPGVLMPSFFRTDGFSQVATPYQGKTVLTAQQVEDLVAYLGQLKDYGD